ncbi:thioredoxin H-type, putative [Entamoeba invadens IP1]|uniref:Thioredoxin n=1 Tax=Entamoeba invadens IP1 TaxID=370355 RepID=L7FJX6_ENTIV|nr:thioredoxin H-type, putative [Entamoeba invadens IP1]ELP84850.1 thioredoxin H-type, putative [Entamoeba invadens IP1]|eukprot:XP_004184196.1 thioredoxin H-type, putative [Entamoeba invadens IP1]
MAVLHINSVEDLSRILDTNVIIFDFFATWCGPCKSIAPVFEDLANKNPKVKFVKVDVEAGEEIAQNYEITAMPTFILSNKGDVVDRIKGADIDGLNALVAKASSLL